MAWICERVPSNSNTIPDFHDDSRLRSPLNASWISLATIRAFLWTLLVALWMTGPCAGFAQAQTTGPPQETLEQEFTDPLTTLPQFFLKDVYSPANYGTAAQTNTLVARAIIPRIRRFLLLPFDQFIRPTFQLVTVPSARGGTRTEFGDLPLFDVALLPWPDQNTGIKIGLGTTFVFPTATSRSAGQGAWQAGPALGAIYTGIPGLLVGFLFQNPISFAYTSPNRRPQNTVEFQPALSLHVWRGWYLRSADATWTSGWRRHSPTMLPLSFGVGDVMVRPGLPPLNFYVAGQWMVYRQFSPIAPQTSVIFGVTVAFPELRDWWNQP